jgi:nucleoside phosphorylase
MRLGLVVALPEEARAVSRAIRVERRHRHERSDQNAPRVQAISGRTDDLSVEIAWAGAGEARAASAARALLRAGIDSLLAVGFAGALTSELRPGDLLLASRVVAADGASWAADASLRDLLAGAAAAWAGATVSTRPAMVKPSFHQGSLVTVPRVLTTSLEKQRLGKETGASAVDMESAAVAGCAADAGVPMAALRAITDAVDEQLPLDFNRCLDSDGQFHHGRLILLLARRPGAVGGLIRLGLHSSRAGQALASLLAVALPALDAL